jgi:hypothetical protein
VPAASCRTVYLDLNHWYALGDALLGQPQRPEDVDVLQELTGLVDRGQIMCPLSAVHYMELAENPRDEQRAQAAAVMALLSRFNTITAMTKIVDEELALALNKRYGRPGFPVKVKKFGVGATFALTGERKALKLTGGDEESRRELEAKLGMPVAELEAKVNMISEYELLKQPPRAYAEDIPDYDPYAARRIADEELESFNVMVNTLRTNPDIATRPLDAICARQFYFEFRNNLARALMSAGYGPDSSPFRGKQEMTEFLMSLPSRRVTVMMQYSYLKDVHRNWTINDLRDIAALSAAIPYCDVVVTDKKAWDAATNRAHLDKEFGAAVFRRLSDLEAYL